MIVYGQTEITRDLMEAASERGLEVIYGVEDVALHDITLESPFVTFRKDGTGQRIDARFVIGCDGFHVPSRKTIPVNVAREFERVYPFGWLGILADVPPCHDELIYANHERGFALASMRSKTRSRYYIDVPLTEKVEDWSDDRVWDELAAARLFTGLGIGGMLATSNALVAEYANDKWRGAAVAVMAAGYPMGAIAGGAFASNLLATGDWRDVFMLGAVMTALFLPLVPFLLPEPVSALLQNRRGDTLGQVNHSLVKLGHAGIATLPPVEAQPRKASVGELFAPGTAPVTVPLTLAYFLHIMTFYFILKWVPKIVIDMGFTPASAGGVLVWANVGGLIGGLLFSALSLRFTLRALLVAFMLASTVMVAVFGQGQADLHGLSLAAAAGGFCTNAGVVGLYALVASSFPTAIRGGGTGFVIGVGRGGAALGPILGGLLFAAGFGLPVVAALMASGSLLAALALLALPKRLPDGA